MRNQTGTMSANDIELLRFVCDGGDLLESLTIDQKSFRGQITKQGHYCGQNLNRCKDSRAILLLRLKRSASIETSKPAPRNASLMLSEATRGLRKLHKREGIVRPTTPPSLLTISTVPDRRKAPSVENQ